jgi:phosphomannomutase
MFDLNSIFKAYDVRGIYPEQINEKVVRRIGEAYSAVRQPKKVAVGRDVRNSGEKLKAELISALLDCGVDVVDIGTITTDQLYFAVGKYKLDGGISVTASHNPGVYNGLKFSEAGGAPVSSDNLEAIRNWAMASYKSKPSPRGILTQQEILDDYLAHVRGYIDNLSLKSIRVLANANFGAVGRVVDKLAERFNITLERLNWEEDGSFPKGPPNPLLPENRQETIAKIKETKPDFGVAWDADADRVFFFTGNGEFVPSCYIVAILSQKFLKKYPGSKIVHDVTTSWVIDDAIHEAGGIPVMNRTGHTFMKARMRQEDAPFAGESSGHYYFRDSYYADNGIVPFLMILEMICKTGLSLTEIVESLMSKYKVSGEINFEVSDPAKAIKQIEAEYGQNARIDRTDGLAVETDDWRFSVRPSNTEPLFRLNAEAHDPKILDNLVKEITSVIKT